MQNKEMKSLSESVMKLFRKQIFIPIAALLVLAVFNLITDPPSLRLH